MWDLPRPGIEPMSPLRWQVDSQPLYHHGSPRVVFIEHRFNPIALCAHLPIACWIKFGLLSLSHEGLHICPLPLSPASSLSPPPQAPCIPTVPFLTTVLWHSLFPLPTLLTIHLFLSSFNDYSSVTIHLRTHFFTEMLCNLAVWSGAFRLSSHSPLASLVS